MKNPFLCKRLLLFSTGVLCFFSSCIQADYDLSKGVNTEISIGGDSLMIPLLKSGPLSVKSIIDSIGQDVIKLNQQGEYSFQLNDSVKEELNSITPVSVAVNPIEFNRIYINLAESGLRDGSANRYFKLPENSQSFTIAPYLSSELLKVYSAEFIKPVKVVFRLEIENVPDDISEVELNNYKITFPDNMQFAAGTTNEQNQVVLTNVTFDPRQGFSQTFILNKLDFGSDGVLLRNGTLECTNSMLLGGDVTFKSKTGNISSGVVSGVKTSFTVDQLNVSYLDGQINHPISAINRKMELKLPDYLKDKDVSLDIYNPAMSVQVGNPTGVPLDVTCNIRPWRDGAIISDGVVSKNLTINAATNPGEMTWSKYWIAKSADGMSSGYTPLLIPNISSVLKKAPDSIDIDIEPRVIGLRHRFCLTKKNVLDIKYNVAVPLQFGNTFHVNFQDTIADLHNQLADGIAYTRKVQLMTVVDNQIPLNLNFGIVPLDNNQSPIPDIDITITGAIAAVHKDGSASSSKLIVLLKERVYGALDKLDGFQYKVSASSDETIAGIPLRPEQAVSIALKAFVPGGVSLTSK